MFMDDFNFTQIFEANNFLCIIANSKSSNFNEKIYFIAPPPGRHLSRQTPLQADPTLDRPPWADTSPPQMTTAAVGTHPTGMHSCSLIFFRFRLV